MSIVENQLAKPFAPLPTFCHKNGTPRKVSRKISENGQQNLLLSLVRMGSFQDPARRVPMSSELLQQDELDLYHTLQCNTIPDLIKYCDFQCEAMASNPASIFRRRYLRTVSSSTEISATKPMIGTDGAVLPEGSAKPQAKLRVMQWNVLAQALGLNYDRFDCCSKNELQWSYRKWRLLQEILQYLPLDVICLQEIDHYSFVSEILRRFGYESLFVGKPDSPCYYLAGNTGPDGCAIFWNTNTVSLLRSAHKTVEVCDCPSNQVILSGQFVHLESRTKFVVATTHLKARKGPILARMREEQGKDLLQFIEGELNKNGETMPVIVTGDFNAESCEPVYEVMTSRLTSAYADALGTEPDFTNWTRREGESETRHTIDYVFYSKGPLTVDSILDTASSEPSGPFPNVSYASDHLSLIVEFTIR